MTMKTTEIYINHNNKSKPFKPASARKTRNKACRVSATGFIYRGDRMNGYGDNSVMVSTSVCETESQSSILVITH